MIAVLLPIPDGDDDEVFCLEFHPDEGGGFGTCAFGRRKPREPFIDWLSSGRAHLSREEDVRLLVTAFGIAFAALPTEPNVAPSEASAELPQRSDGNDEL